MSATDTSWWTYRVVHTACSVERTGSGSVVIWMLLPTRLDTMNMSMPSFIMIALVDES